MSRPRNPSYTYLADGKGRIKPHRQITCGQCGKDTMIRVDSAAGRFCSRACAVAWRHAQGIMPPSPKGAESPEWKGSDASYSAMHKRVVRTRGRAGHCENREAAGCRSRTYQWAHIHHTDPGDPANYRQLCRVCHVAYDEQLGTGNARAKLLPAQVREIRSRYAAGGITYKLLAAEFGVTAATISNIILHRRYREVT